LRAEEVIMRRLFLRKVFGTAAAILAWTGQTKGTRLMAQEPSSDVNAIEVFQMSELLARRARSGKAWLPFLNVPSLRCGVYVLEAGADDPQNPHDDDEVYYVENGRGKIRVNGEDYDVEPGGIIFVKAHAEHKFHSIEQDLKVLVFFSSAKA
jgi:mannose-6-phosphate isomerase-like protein (cupin superfamily)